MAGRTDITRRLHSRAGRTEGRFGEPGRKFLKINDGP